MNIQIEGKRKRGTPKTTWGAPSKMKYRKDDVYFTWGTIERKASNREEWRKLVLVLYVP
jgi:hypothetical protein